MFGFTNECLIKKELILTLDRQKESISSQELTQEVGHVNSQTTLKYLLDIQKNIEATYAPESLQLEISRRVGVRLFRQNTNFDRLFEVIYQENLVYAIMSELLEYRQFATDIFCTEHKISLSGLRRRINAINESLAPYDVSLSVGKKVKIRGEEARIRLIFFSFFYTIDHGVQDVPFIQSEVVVKKARQLCYYLGIEPKEATIDLLALWLHINEKAIKLNQLLDEKVRNELFKTKKVKPTFLNLFEAKDWHYFLKILNGLDFISLAEIENFQAEHENKFTADTASWIDLFEKHFAGLEIVQKESLVKMMYKNALLDDILPLAGELFSGFIPVNEQELTARYPQFMTHFSDFWREYCQKTPRMANDFVEKRSLLFCFLFASDQEFLPVLSVCLLSNLMLVQQAQIKRHLSQQLKNTVALSFVELPSLAELVLETSDYSKDEGPGDHVTISPILSYHDIDSITKAVKFLK